MAAPKNPYLVPVYELVHQPGHERELELDVAAPEKLGEGLIAVEAGEELDIDLRLDSLHEGILASGHVSATAKGVCGRCLIDIAEPVEVDFQELFAYSVEEGFDFQVRDDSVDLEPLVRDAVVLALPFQPVCRPDCPGLDPETGERLADHPELLKPRESVDPRWAALTELTQDTETEER